MTAIADRLTLDPRVAECEGCYGSSEQVLNMTRDRSGRLLCLTCRAERAQYGADLASPEAIYLANIEDIYGGRPPVPLATAGYPACAECGAVYPRRKMETKEGQPICPGCVAYTRYYQESREISQA